MRELCWVPNPCTRYSLSNWRVSKASETLSRVYKFELMCCVYIYIHIYMYGGMCAIIVVYATYT